jgi:hypothetical protein
MGSLAPELWILIAGFLPLASLCNLCTTSKYFLKLIRPILYRSIIFRKTSSSRMQETWTLLSNDPWLAEHVINLSVLTLSIPPIYFRESFHSPNLPLNFFDALWNMTSLRSLHVNGSIFHNTNEKKAFVSKINEQIVPLKKLRFEDDGVLLPDGDFSLSNLTAIDWHEKRCT